MINNRTPNYDWPLVHPDNFQEDDVPRLIATLLSIDGGLFALQQLAEAIQQVANDALPADGTAVQAARLQTARLINGVAFDGTADITINTGTFVAVSAAADVTIGPLEFAHITNAAAAVMVAVPAVPEEGQMVMVGNLTPRLDHSIDVGSNKVKGQVAGSLVIDRAYTTITMKYISAAYGWEVL